MRGLRRDVPEPLRGDVERRWRASRAEAERRGCGALLVFSRADRPGDVLYLAGHRPGMAGHVTRARLRGRGYAALLLPIARPPVLMVTTPFYEGGWTDEVRADTDLPRLVGATLRDAGLERATVALVGDDILSALLDRELKQTLPEAHWVPADDLVMTLRSRKSAYELDCLRRGSAMADLAGERARRVLQTGVAESEVAALIVGELRAAGAELGQATCQSGVARSGEPLAYPPVSDRELEAGDMVHMEINGRADGYLIDICRSTVVGVPSPAQRRLLEVSLEMLEAAIAAVRPGVPACEISDIAGAIATREHLGAHFTVDFGGPGTYVGHGIGVANDEPPVLGLGDRTPLAAGMVLTIEPGLYRTPVGGCRIEDTVLVTEGGAEVMTKVDRVWWG